MRLCPGNRSITLRMLVQQIGDFQRFQHVCGVPVSTKTDPDSLTQHRQYRGATDGIAHVRFRVVHDQRLLLLQYFHLVRIDMNAVGGYR